MNYMFILLSILVIYLIFINISNNDESHQNPQKEENKEIINDLTKYSEYKFKVSRDIASGISKLELEDFLNYAPKNITIPDYLYVNENYQKDDNNTSIPMPLDEAKEIKFKDVNITSEMTTQWDEKTSKDAHSFYFKLMDNLPRVSIPDPTSWK